MTNLLLENTNESKVDELMESLVNDYKQSLKTKEEDERYILESQKNYIDFMENYHIPFLSKKYGLNSFNKEMLNNLLILIVNIRRDMDLTHDEESTKGVLGITFKSFFKKTSTFIEKLNSSIHNHTKDYELIDKKLLHLKETFETVEIIKELYLENKNKSDESSLFSFHKDSWLKLNLRIQELNLEKEKVIEEFEKSKQQCIKVIKKINYELEKLKNYWLSTDLSKLIENALKLPYLKLKVKEIDICNTGGRFHFTIFLDI
jgi:hypothetical protein